ncbi:MAG: hypothetical protein O2779_00730 [Nanoarchaeota archaeon]|nr:hypothetical protein [Nanoarchaeota archaeon]
MNGVIGLDVSGTVLDIGDAENVMPPRKGIEYLFDYADAEGILVVGASDENCAFA